MSESSGMLPDDALPRRAKKAPTAFRTISEVADDCTSRSTCCGSGRPSSPRSSRSSAVAADAITGPRHPTAPPHLRSALYQGYTIKGVQRLLREGGGQLADDIPPAPASERAAAEAERAEPPILPGLEPSAPAKPVVDDQIESMRAVLETVLAELLELRALLDVGDTAKSRNDGA